MKCEFSCEWLSHIWKPDLRNSAEVGKTHPPSSEIMVLICGNKMPTRCNRGFLLQILLLAQHVSGHHYAHHQELKSIIQWLLPVVFRAVVFKLLVWCGAEGYVS